MPAAMAPGRANGLYAVVVGEGFRRTKSKTAEREREFTIPLWSLSVTPDIHHTSQVIPAKQKMWAAENPLCSTLVRGVLDGFSSASGPLASQYTVYVRGT